MTRRGIVVLSLLLWATSLQAEPSLVDPLPLDPLPEAVLRDAAARAFSEAELARHDGRDADRPLLMAVRGVVFDVSEASRFYGPESAYHVLAARDASRAVARMSLAPADLTDRCEGLEPEALQRLATVMRDTYLRKYPVVGHLAGGAFFPRGLCCHADECGDCRGEQ